MYIMYILNFVNLRYSFSKTCQTPALSGELKLEEAMNPLQDRLCSLNLGPQTICDDRKLCGFPHFL
jgi:hypothetical protein